LFNHKNPIQPAGTKLRLKEAFEHGITYKSYKEKTRRVSVLQEIKCRYPGNCFERQAFACPIRKCKDSF